MASGGYVVMAVVVLRAPAAEPRLPAVHIPVAVHSAGVATNVAGTDTGIRGAAVADVAARAVTAGAAEAGPLLDVIAVEDPLRPLVRPELADSAVLLLGTAQELESPSGLTSVDLPLFRCSMAAAMMRRRSAITSGSNTADSFGVERAGGAGKAA